MKSLGRSAHSGAARSTRSGPDAGRFDALALARLTEAGDAPDLVVPRESLRQRKGHAAGRARHEDLLAAKRSRGPAAMRRHTRLLPPVALAAVATGLPQPTALP